MKLSYICTNYNNSTYTRTAIETLLCDSHHNYAVIVVDNNSDTKNVDILRSIESENSCVEVVYLKENIGYFRGLNVGINLLRKNHPSITWAAIGNNDLQFPDDFATNIENNLVRFSVWPVISPDIITLDGEHQNPHVIEKISPIREFFYDAYYFNYYLGIVLKKLASITSFISDRTDEHHWRIAQPIYQGHGSCYIITPKFFDLFEELWAPTFIGAEEFFLSKQLSDSGYKIFYDPCVQVTHCWHASLETLPNRRRWELFKNAHREYRKHVKVFN